MLYLLMLRLTGDGREVASILVKPDVMVGPMSPAVHTLSGCQVNTVTVHL